VTESSQSDASESDSSETADPASAIAPGYVLAQGRLASALPLVGVSLRTIGGTTSSAARRRGADSTIAARHGQLAERYAGLFGRSRGVFALASRLLCLAELQPAVPEDDRALHQAVLNRLTRAVPPMPAGLAADMAETELGLGLHEFLADFSPRPIAPSPIGQVHAAQLFDGSEDPVPRRRPGDLLRPLATASCLRFDMIACLLVLPFAAIADLLRHIPAFWTPIDCPSAGIGIVLLLRAYRHIRFLERTDPDRGPMQANHRLDR
jgi:hypothetical protein